MLLVARLGAFIPVPGINSDIAQKAFRQQLGGSQNLFQMVDLFSGGAFAQMTVTALSVMPYISASIAMQLILAMFPALQRDFRENPEFGKQKVARWTRYGALILALVQSLLFARYILAKNDAVAGIVIPDLANSFLFYVVVASTMTAGTMLLIWLGEQISDRGIGNGMSLIIAMGIVSSFPSTIGAILQQLNLEDTAQATLGFGTLALLILLFLCAIAGVIWLTLGERKITIQHARRPVGPAGRYQNATSSHLPLKVNFAGVIPVIFASSFLMVPASIAQFMYDAPIMLTIARWLSPGSLFYSFVFIALIFLLSFFWVSTQFHPDQLASDMKRSGAFIPGVRQGKPTQKYLENAMVTITAIGAAGLSLLALFPQILTRALGVSPTISYFFGGTSLLILVGVILETKKQIDAALMSGRYKGMLHSKSNN